MRALLTPRAGRDVRREGRSIKKVLPAHRYFFKNKKRLVFSDKRYDYVATSQQPAPQIGNGGGVEAYSLHYRYGAYTSTLTLCSHLCFDCFASPRAAKQPLAHCGPIFFSWPCDRYVARIAHPDGTRAFLRLRIDRRRRAGLLPRECCGCCGARPRAGTRACVRGGQGGRR